MKPDAPKLLGKYRTPRFRYGDVVKCAVRGEVVTVGMRDAPIPWPVGKPRKKGGRRDLILCGDPAGAAGVHPRPAGSCGGRERG
jgi:hypothetical protein